MRDAPWIEDPQRYEEIYYGKPVYIYEDDEDDERSD